jgi:hypothetical protein
LRARAPASRSARSRCSAPADGTPSSFASAAGQVSAPASSAIDGHVPVGGEQGQLRVGRQLGEQAVQHGALPRAIGDRHRRGRLGDEHEVRRADRAPPPAP